MLLFPTVTKFILYHFRGVFLYSLGHGAKGTKPTKRTKAQWGYAAG